MKILVISDSHGRSSLVKEAIEKESPFDMLIHCGDLQADFARDIGLVSGAVYCVRGNCDPYASYPKEHVIEAAGHKIYVTHGHLLDVDWGNDLLIRRAASYGCDLALYGHTHVPELTKDEASGVFIMNPGSIARPRCEDRRRSYGIITLEEGKTPSGRIVKLPR